MAPTDPGRFSEGSFRAFSGLGRQMATGGPQKAHFYNFQASGTNWPEGGGFKMKPHLVAAFLGLRRNLDFCLGSGFKMKPYLLAAFLGLRRHLDFCLRFFLRTHAICHVPFLCTCIF